MVTMKHFFLVFAIVILLNTGCTKTNSLNSFNLQAKVVSQLTNQAIPGAKIYIRVASKESISGIFVHVTLLDSFTVVSDNSGNISCRIKYNNDPNISVEFNKVDDTYSTGFFFQRTEYLISELKNLTLLTFYVRKYANLKINVKNINPLNDNDAIDLYISQDSTHYYNNIIDSIHNFRVMNQPLVYPAANDGRNPYWIGKDVNSTIYGKIQEGTTYQITWEVSRNGVHTINKSLRLKTSINSLNLYDILY
jgi:hypothetical protein